MATQTYDFLDDSLQEQPQKPNDFSSPFFPDGYVPTNDLASYGTCAQYAVDDQLAQMAFKAPTPPDNAFTVFGDTGSIIVDRDGSIEITGDITMDESAKIFWDAISCYAPANTDTVTKLENENNRLEQQVLDLKEKLAHFDSDAFLSDNRYFYAPHIPKATTKVMRNGEWVSFDAAAAKPQTAMDVLYNNSLMGHRHIPTTEQDVAQAQDELDILSAEFDSGLSLLAAIDSGVFKKQIKTTDVEKFDDAMGVL